MTNTQHLDFAPLAHELGLPLASVQRTVELLDDGNTVAFITRFRKDHTGGLDEELVRSIQLGVRKLRTLVDRKHTILKSIETQGKLTPELTAAIQAAQSPKRLEDLYLPFKPKKQTLATLARQRGLEPFVREILDAASAAEEIERRAADFVAPENGLPTTSEVLAGVRHLLAEHFSEHAELRSRLRKVMQRAGRLVSTRLETGEAKSPAAGSALAEAAAETASPAAAETPAPEPAETPAPEPAETAAPEPAETAAPAAAETLGASAEGTPAEGTDDLPAPSSAAEAPAAGVAAAETEIGRGESSFEHSENGGGKHSHDQVVALAGAAPDGPEREVAVAAVAGPAPLAVISAKRRAAEAARARAAERKAKLKEKKRRRLEAAFRDFFQYQETLQRVPPHRVLALNRGERARILRVRIEADLPVLLQTAEELLIPAGHRHEEFLRGCVRDALTRLVLPSLERELRRELTERAESRAVEVFVRNLRTLLLQPPVRNRRVLAVDPGFRSGCKLVALDEFGNVLGHAMMYVVGKDEQRQEGRSALVRLVQQHQLSVIAIGNGAGCRGTEQVVADVLGLELKDSDISYTIVNEAGTNEYSTSAIGREELPDMDPTLRSAISIGRRLLDPLSELVKVNPANLGIGLYQHDLKAKHLRDSLDAVVESCVNFVGVEANTASPALLRYVSGFNQLTARRLYDYRCEHGPFHSRDEIKQVPGLGEAAFVQAAGFLKIVHGDNPLDATWIHPESYEIVGRLLEKLGVPLPPAPVRSAAAAPAGEAAPPAESKSAGLPAELPAGDSPPPPLAAAPDQEPLTVPESAAGASAAGASASDEVAPTEAAAPVRDGAGAGRALATAPQPAFPLAPRLLERVSQTDTQLLLSELNIGELLFHDLLNALTRQGRDPREDLPPPIFRRGIMRLEDLQPGMELTGTVLNVVDFGAFVDIGVSDSGLVHISRLADRYVRDPHEIVSVGDVIRVWVVEVDRPRRRVSLTAIRPGSERPAPQEGGPPVRQGNRPPRGGRGKPAPTAARTEEAPKGSVRPPRHSDRPPPKPPKPPRPVVPLTKEMEEGKEPMRSFSDLLQFYSKKKKPD